MHLRSLCVATLLVLPLAAQDPPEPSVRISMAAPDVLSIIIENGRAISEGLRPYEAQPGDSVRTESNGERYVVRGGRKAGGLTGSGEKLFYRPWDRVEKKDLNLATALEAANWKVSSTTDGNYVDPRSPVKVSRKSKLTDARRIGEWSFRTVDKHVLYLWMPTPPQPTGTYKVEFPKETGLAPAEFTFQPMKNEMEPLHVNHLGFRPDDPRKLAFLSLWTGSSGGYSFPKDQVFFLLNDETGELVFAEVAKPAKDERPGEDAYGYDHTKTEVLALDFSNWTLPGRYRIMLWDLGVSQPFEIGADNTWRKALTFAARGLYHQRSGVELTEPYTDYIRPRPYHPDDGVQVFLSKQQFVTPDPALGDQAVIFKRLVANVTDEVVPNAWGGYFDAGDWDRHIYHLGVSRMLMRAWEFHPDYFRDLDLNIPEAPTVLPDLLEEALWCVEFFQRLQTPEGGVRGGIEAAEHPRFPDTSWLETLKVMTWEPDMASSWLYAGSAAQAAHLIAPFDEARANTLRESALRAWDWAEREYASYSGAPLRNVYADSRNLAAVELWRLTAEARFHDVFLATNIYTKPGMDLDIWATYDQHEAAASYLLESTLERDAAVVENMRSAVKQSADMRVSQGKRTNFRWTKHEWAPTGWGVLGAPLAEYLIYGHKFLGDPAYLDAILAAAVHSLGANPINMTYTTGLGHDWPRRPLIVDVDMTAHPNPPKGIVIYGPAHNMTPWSLVPSTNTGLHNAMFPKFEEWPTVESYVNLGILDPNTNEYTVNQTNAPAVFTWGYLAARP